MKNLKKIYSTLTHYGTDLEPLGIEDKKRIIATNQIALLLFIVAFPYTFIFSFISPKLGFPVIFIECLFSSILILNKHSFHNLAKLGLLFTANIGAFAYSFILGVSSGVHLLLIAFAGLPLILFNPIENKEVNFGIFLPISLQVIIQFIPNNILIFSISTEYMRLMNKTAVFAVTLIVVLYVRFFSTLILDYAAQLLKKNYDLESRNITIETQYTKLQISQKIQLKLIKEKEKIRLEAAELAGVQKTIASLNHELNSPLCAVLMGAKSLEKGILDHTLKKTADTIYQASQKMDKVLKKISKLTNTKTINYFGKVDMLDLS